ncbi:MAG: class I SAM-dependent methyltransferase [Acidimicrobiales bacterium]
MTTWDHARRANLARWEERAPAHAASAEYGFDRLAADPSALSGVVRFDLPRLGRLDGLDVVHLQCHVGTDTVSLARLGARSVTGLDFSRAALTEAERLAARCGADVAWVEAEVHDAASVLGAGRFDLVYTGIGALCWLPSGARWAQAAAALLHPGGRLFVRETHPLLWALDERRGDGLLTLEHAWFEQAEPARFDEPGTYVSTDVAFASNLAYEWSHGLGDLIGAVLASGLTLTAFDEHDSVPWNALEGQMVEGADGEWRLRDRPERLAASYTLQAGKAS